MRLIVNPHKIVIEKEPVNEKEIDITKCEFEFSEEITDDFVKDAYFTFKGTTYKQIIQNNECAIPYEVLSEKGQVEIGVVAYKVENDEEIKRYNPSPAYFNTWIGSLKEEYENTEPVTPTDKEQIEQAITNLENGKQDTLVSGENIKTLNNESLLGRGNIEIEVDLSDYYTKEETYSKGEVDSLIPDLTNYVKNTDFATSTVGGVLRTSVANGSQLSSGGILQATTRTYAQYQNDVSTLFIGKGTLENVITGKDLTTKAYVDGLVGDLENILETLDIGSGV